MALFFAEVRSLVTRESMFELVTSDGGHDLPALSQCCGVSDARPAARADHATLPFWRDLKAGHDAFDATLLPPRIQVCNGRYVATSIASDTTDGRTEIIRKCEPPGRAAALR